MMDENISKLANSVNLVERKQALKAFLATADWSNYKELASLFLNDPDVSILKELVDAILTKCPEKFLPELKLLAIEEDKEIRSKVLSYLCELDSFKNLDLFLERLPLEEPALAGKLRTSVKKMLDRDTKYYLKQLLACLGSDNEAVRKEAMSIFVSYDASFLREFYLFMQSISPSIREKILLTAKKDHSWFTNNSLELLKSESEPNIRLQTIALLQFFAYPQLEDALISEMNQKDWALRHYVIKSLAELKSEKAKTILIEAMEDKELSIQAIIALDSYRQPDIGIIFLRKLGKSTEDEQMALLNGIKNVAASDKRFIEPLLVFAAHDVCKLNAKKLALEVVNEICVKTSTPKPAKADEIEAQIRKLLMGDIPDLGLKFAD